MPKWLKVLGVIVACAVMIAAVVVRVATAKSGVDNNATIPALRSAASKSLAANSERVKIDETMTLLGFKDTTHEVAVVSLSKKQSRLTTSSDFSLGDLGKIPGSANPGGSSSNRDSGSEERQINGTTYLDFAGLSTLFPDVPKGKHWLRVPKGPGVVPEGGGLGALGFGTGLNPAEQYLKMLSALSGTVERVRAERVNQQDAVHYRTFLDYGKLSRLPAMSQSKAKLAHLGVTPVDIWIDHYNRLLKLRFHVDAEALGPVAALFPGKVLLTVEISQFGLPVSVKAPPPDQLLDLSHLLKGLKLPDLPSLPSLPGAPDSAANA
jgi:hypothetical protein